MRPLVFAWLWIAVSVAGIPWARAEGTIRKEMTFLGFTEDGSRFLLQIHDANTGDSLSFRSVETGKAEKTIPVESPGDLEPAVAKARKSLRIRDAGVEGPTSPDGRYTLILVPKGPRTQIRVLRGERQAVLQTLDARGGGDGPIQWMLKSVHWSSDGRSLVLLLHRKEPGMVALDTDQAISLRFMPSELQFGATP
ncbi:MAG TPA: hypothetical protein PLQ97_02255 [Myxococcota bacterium]|nr:hypothetical protein [Myxococcota bacterium]HQK50288.1 hypothetical protein [Myxococcota bacterium]